MCRAQGGDRSAPAPRRADSGIFPPWAALPAPPLAHMPGSTHPALASTTALAAFAAAAAAGVAFGRWLARPHALLRLRLKLAALSGREFVLADVRVPSALLTPAQSSKFSADSEGMVRCDVHIADGKIALVTAPGAPSASTILTPSIDCKGSILCACFVDAHTHLVKTHAHPRARNPTGSINDALATEMEDQPRWAACACCRPLAFAKGGSATASADDDKSCVPCPRADDVVRRMDFALASSFHHGARAIRTHLDGTNAPDAKLRATVYAAFDACRARWGKKGLLVQGVANLYLPLWQNAALAEKHVAEAVSHEGALLGAYCGNVADTPEHETAAALDALFSYAIKHNLAVDLHIDETNDKKCCCLLPLVHALKRARAQGYAREVLLGHCTSLSLQDDAVKKQVIVGLASLGAVAVICNPATNLGLQDRRGSLAPHCCPISADIPRTPLWRGLTLVQELAAGGVCVGAGSDNVRDWWHPYGDYDGLANYKGAITMGHLDTAPNEGSWAHLVSDAPAFAIGAPAAEGVGSALAEGAVADLILFPSSRRASELLSRPQGDRIVLRRGYVQESSLPPYELLDDIVARPTDVSAMQSEGSMSSVARGATPPVK